MLSGTVVNNVVHVRLVRRVRIRARFQPSRNQGKKRVAALAAGQGLKARADAAPPSGTTEVVPGYDLDEGFATGYS
jgi:hypothetical protein